MRWLSTGLAYLIFLQTMPAQEGTVSKLNITIVEGEGAINNIRQRTAREPIVQVEDQNHKPVAGAVVVFTLPSQGASGVFPNGSTTLNVFTDANGRAAARGFRPNSVQGRMNIHVNASYQGQTASAVITQTNALTAAAAAGAAGATKGVLSLKWLLIIAAAGGAAAAGTAVAVTRGGGTPAAVPSTTVTPGTGTVGAPR